MRIYKYGEVSEAIHARIENAKQSVKNNARPSVSFSDVLRGHMTVDESARSVAPKASEASPVPSSVNGSMLLYALQNSEEDTTAGAVLDMLGFSDYSDTAAAQLRDAAAGLADSASMLITLGESDTVNAAAVSDFVTDYNNLVTRLTAESNSSAYLYRTALSSALTTAGNELASAGFTQDNGRISYNAAAGGRPPLDFLATVVSAAEGVSAYASSVAAEDESDNGISDYYTALMNGMM